MGCPPCNFPVSLSKDEVFLVEALLNLQAMTHHISETEASLADMSGIAFQPLSVHISRKMELKYVTAIAKVVRLVGSCCHCGLAFKRRR